MTSKVLTKKGKFTEFDYLWAKTYLLSNELIEKYATKLNFAIERWDMDIQN